jgi:hypothetical protein
MVITGPEINIDQVANKAWVNGLGSLKMPSETDLNGQKLAKPRDLIIHWNEDMYFNGQYAVFHGGSQAEQDNGRLACQDLQVFFDQAISLRGGEKRDKQARVKDLVCDQKVRIEDSTREGPRLVRYQRLLSQELTLNNEDGIVNATGPGVVYLLQPGTKGDILPAGPTGEKPGTGQPNGTATAARPSSGPAEEEIQLTRVKFQGKLWANNPKRVAVFYDNVEVIHLPADNPDVPINPDRLPVGGLSINCEQLKVFTSRAPDGTTSQEMEAVGKVFVQAQEEFSGRANVVKYDERKEQIIFEGDDTNPATLYRVKSRGGDQEKIQGEKITYWRRTGDYKVDKGYGISGRQ